MASLKAHKVNLDRLTRFLKRLKSTEQARQLPDDEAHRQGEFQATLDTVVQKASEFESTMLEFELAIDEEYPDETTIPDHVSQHRTVFQDFEVEINLWIRNLRAELATLQLQADQRQRDIATAILKVPAVGQMNSPQIPATRQTTPGSVTSQNPNQQPSPSQQPNSAGIHAVPNAVPPSRLSSPGLSIHTAVSHVSPDQPTAPDLITKIKLPNLQVPKFRGEPAKWKPFWCRFQNAVARDTRIAAANKLSYLLMFLEGNPLAMVEGLDATDENYEVAVKLLRETYGNETVAVEEIESKLYRMESPKSSAEGLRKFYCEFESHIGSLSGLGQNVSSHHLVGFVLSKLPYTVVANLERTKKPSCPWTVELLRTLLREEVEVREASERRCVKRHVEQSKRPTYKSFAHTSTTEALLAPERRPQKTWNRNRAQTPGTCVFCGKSGHFHDECPTVRSLEERKHRLAALRRCFNCLRRDHMLPECQYTKPCFHCRKEKTHHRSLCPEKFGRPLRRSNENANATEDRFQPAAYTAQNIRISPYQEAPSQPGTTNPYAREMSNLADDEQTILKTALVRVGGSVEEATMEVRMFLDSGCSRTYITEKLARRLKLKMESSRMLTVNRFGGGEGGQHIIEVKTAQLTLKTLYGRSFRIKVAVTPNIMNRMMKVAISHELLCRIPRDVVLADSPFSDNREVEIEFLLGNDYYDDFVTGRRIDIAPGFRLIESEFGWITSGRVPDDQSSACEIVALYSQELANMNISDELIVETSSDDVKHSPIEDMWSLESLGITDNPNPVSDDSALEQFNKTIKFEDGRYQVTWPWRANANELPSNYDVAKRRLQTTVNRLTNTPGLMERYNTVIQDQLEKSVIEETEEETSDRVHYLPHREVLTPDKETTKLRIVYDASARASPDKPSLNDCLHRGLIFTTALLCLLMRFMLAPIVVISDIEKAFLQVGLQVHERDVTRFLWLRDITKAITPDNLVIYRFTRVAFGMSPSPFLLGATIAHHLRLSLLEIARLIERNSYVDNVITGFRTVSEAIQFYHQSKELFRQASMNLREFASNSTEFMHSIPQVDRVSKMTMKVLGIGWNIQTDMLYLNVPSTFPDAKTKRHLMQGLLKIYDPIGFVSPVIIRSRLLLQRICQGKGKRWNEALRPSEIEEYRAIIVEYEKFRNIRWPRYFGHEIDQSCRLMCFCDASKQAYATVIYLQKQDGDDRFSSRILFAKSRVCPLKSHMSIPRLELMALLIGVRGIKFIREQLAFTGRVVIWSDSQCVLKWMGSNRVQGTFVENRLREIKKVPKLEFKYVPTKDNPADLPSRGVGTDELTEFWWKGPKWSMASESEWPNIEVDVKCSQAKGELEEMSETSPSAGYEVTLAEVSSYQPPYGIDLEKFSTYESLIRVTAWCCRFHDHALRRRKESSKQLRPAELRNAEQLWLQFIQVAFSDLRAAMLTNKSHSLRNQLGTAIDSNGIIRCKGRMGAMQGSTDKRFPILLPAKNRFTKLLIERYHKICLHAGKKMTLNTVRRRFWIPHGATAVSQVIKRCVICRKVDGVGFARPQMPDLPSYRVNRTFPFEHTGLDYFGPMSVKDSTHEQPTKVWGCIFTCLTTRAIHLELVSSLAADDFLMALRRFISRRGRPRMILCR